MNSALRKLQTALLLAAMLVPAVSTPSMTLSLTKRFVTKYKDKVTIITTLHIDEHHPRPNSVAKDGDIHMAGRDTEALLPMVAEIPNGSNEPEALKFLRETAKGQPVKITGVWRLWFEHPSADGTLQNQGDPVDIPGNSNPKHVFEIHPVTKFDRFDCGDSFLPVVDDQKKPTEEFEPTPATTAFPDYNTRQVVITRSQKGIMINSKKAQYNYTDFFIKLTGKPKDVGDGFIVFANVSATKNFGEPLLVKEPLRMIFAKDTPPAKALKGLAKGAKLHVMGVPRVNLHDVFDRASVLGIDEKSTGQLPYEMIIVAILK